MNDESRILVVDDDQSIASEIVDLLVDEGHDACSVGGELMLKTMDAWPAHVIILDMGASTDARLAEISKLQESHPHTQVIALADAALPHQAMRRVGNKAFAYLSKPADMRQLLVLVRRALERFHTVEELNYAQALLHAIMDASTLAVAVLDRDGDVSAWNSAAERILGWSTQEVLGTPFRRLLRERCPGLDVNRVLSGREEAGAEVTACRRKDGSQVDICVSSATVTRADGGFAGTVVVIADLTALKHVEDPVEEHRKRAFG